MLAEYFLGFFFSYKVSHDHAQFRNFFDKCFRLLQIGSEIEAFQKIQEVSRVLRDWKRQVEKYCSIIRQAENKRELQRWSYNRRRCLWTSKLIGNHLRKCAFSKVLFSWLQIFFQTTFDSPEMNCWVCAVRFLLNHFERRRF